MKNLSPWAVQTRKQWSIPSVGTPEQIKTCKKLLKMLKAKAAVAFKPVQRFPLSEPIRLQTRTFTNVRGGHISSWSKGASDYPGEKHAEVN